MNVQKLTQKSAETIRNAQRLAVEYGNPQVEQEHLLSALTGEKDSLCAQLLSKMGVSLPDFSKAVQDAVNRLPIRHHRSSRRQSMEASSPRVAVWSPR